MHLGAVDMSTRNSFYDNRSFNLQRSEMHAPATPRHKIDKSHVFYQHLRNPIEVMLTLLLGRRNRMNSSARISTAINRGHLKTKYCH